MKKLISLLLAVSVMLASTSAFAASIGAEGQRNSGGWSDTTGGRNSNYFRDNISNLSQLAVYRTGDTLTFTKGGGDTVFTVGDVVTFISSELDAVTYSDANVMFIDQVTVTSADQKFSYKIREDLADGVYKLEIKNGAAEVDTFYYSVGNPKVEVADIDAEGTQAWVVDNKAQYFAKASIGSSKVMLEQAGVGAIGFDFGDDNVFTIGVDAFDTNKDEVEGASEWWFTMVVTDIDPENVPVATGAILAE